MAHRHETGRKAVAYDLMGVANGHFTLFIKLQEVCGLCKGSFLPIERSSKKSRGHYMRSLPGPSSFHIFPYLSYQVQSMPRPRNARGTTACQRHLAGSSIGSFNDGLRSAALGGSAFEDLQLQGEQREATGGFKVEKCGIMWNITMNNYE